MASEAVWATFDTGERLVQKVQFEEVRACCAPRASGQAVGRTRSSAGVQSKARKAAARRSSHGCPSRSPSAPRIRPSFRSHPCPPPCSGRNADGSCGGLVVCRDGLDPSSCQSVYQGSVQSYAGEWGWVGGGEKNREGDGQWHGQQCTGSASPQQHDARRCTACQHRLNGHAAPTLRSQCAWRRIRRSGWGEGGWSGWLCLSSATATAARRGGHCG